METVAVLEVESSNAFDDGKPGCITVDVTPDLVEKVKSLHAEIQRLDAEEIHVRWLFGSWSEGLVSPEGDDSFRCERSALETRLAGAEEVSGVRGEHLVVYATGYFNFTSYSKYSDSTFSSTLMDLREWDALPLRPLEAEEAGAMESSGVPSTPAEE